jgi:hypothetical protein
MIERPVVFSSEGQQVVAMWHGAEGVTGPAPAVVMCHGFTGHKSEAHRLFVEAARDFAARGLGVLRFDFRGSGDSEGAFVDMTVSSEVRDARAALAHVRTLPEVDTKRIVLFGLSMGGMVTAIASGDEPELAALVLWNPTADLAQIAERRRTEGADQQLREWQCVDQNGWAVGLPFLAELPQLKPLEAILKSNVPVLIVLGEADEVVSPEEGYTYEKILRAAGRSVEVHLVRGGGHTFQTLPHKKEAIEVTGAWLANLPSQKRNHGWKER